MTTLSDAIEKYRPALALEKIVSRKLLSLFRTSFFVLTIFSGVATFILFYFSHPFTLGFVGLTLFIFTLWLEQIIIFAYHNGFYYYGLNSLVDLGDRNLSGATYDVAKVASSHPDDLAFAFCSSTFGSIILLRAGLAPEDVDTYLASSRQKISASAVVLPDDEIFSLIGLGKYLLKFDVDFKKILSQRGISEEGFIGCLRWVIGSYHQEKQRSRFWSKDNLSKTTGLGQAWSYGTAFMLQKFSRSIKTSAVFSTISVDDVYATQKIKEIESILARGQNTNILLIGEPGVGKIDLVMSVQKRMAAGKALASVTNNQILVLDTNRLLATYSDKQTLEVALLNLFDEALLAGNIIIVIENISNFIREAEALGVFIPELLDAHLASPQLRIIATDTPSSFHTFLQPLGAFSRRFTEILIESSDQSATLRLLQSLALKTELQSQVLFTYNGLQAIAVGADRYLVEGVMPDKAVLLMQNVASAARAEGVSLITDDFVYSYINKETGVPVGPITTTERDLLLNLEDKLHLKIVGQDEAIKAIARAMRRARAGIQSSDKPIGSFLFLGPTGVGKTETAKALASVFFGSENNMQRLDMSEFSQPDSIRHLIGDGGESGVLPNLLRDHPYTVLLLDEFEKASGAVHDVFLQILDEGVFTDGGGSKVNARNTIIIATSNAGSQLILKTVEQRKELNHLTQGIIDHIIENRVFKPELINRFDSTVIFEPLNVAQQKAVATLMLGSLYQRIKDQGFELVVTDDLLQSLVEKGYHPEFGARPMLRALQDTIEERVAQKIISGTVKKGDTIKLSLEDVKSKEPNQVNSHE